MSAERAAARPRGRRADSGGTSGLSRPAERAGLSSGGAWPGIRPGRGRQNGPGAPAHRGPTAGARPGRDRRGVAGRSGASWPNARAFGRPAANCPPSP
jgi:hypothetical protein